MSPASRSVSSAWREPVGWWLREISVLLLAGIVGVCPLLAGSVHRPAVTAILLATSVTLVCMSVGERLRGSALRGTQFSIFFLLLVLIPALQVVPLPASWRRVVDPAGSALLDNAPDGPPRTWPLSLDPSATAREIGLAAAALAAFLLALHGATGRKHRLLVVKAIAGAGIVAVVSGIAQRLFGAERLYGLFTMSAAVIPGPFINPNHAAELYELAAFAALALALEAEAEVRIAWFAAAGVNAAASLTTLSRGSFLALLAGGTTFTLLRWRAEQRVQETTPGQPRASSRLGTSVLGTLFAVGFLAAIAFALGASPVLDKLAHTDLMSGTEKVAVWKDSLPVIFHHPAGIGRQAFDRVYPAYKTLGIDSRFQFIENGPLQLLVDTGWVGFALLTVALAWVMRKMPWRIDDVGSALIAALVAVAAHNLVDFGWETLGIRLPFAAIAGVLIGRAYMRGDRERRENHTRTVIAVVAPGIALAGMMFGLWAEGKTSAATIEERWKLATTPEERHTIAVEGGAHFPTDFFFPLLQSFDEPLRSTSGGSSPKLVALNRALRLCPSCSIVHEQTARTLEQLGLRAQALSSFRDTVRLQPSTLTAVLAELDGQGYSPSELATLAVGDGPEIMTVARYLVSKNAGAEVTDLLARAQERGISAVELLLLRADLSIGQGDLGQARTLLGEARQLAPRDGRCFAEMAIVEQRDGHTAAALTDARTATTLSPFVVDFARTRLGLVLQLQKWSELDDALDRLKTALRQNGQSVTEVHVIAGQVHESRGNLGRALSEYRTAVTLEPTNSAAWDAVARVSETRGDLDGALDAYRRIALLRPDDPTVRQNTDRIQKERTDARLKQLLP